MATQIDLFAAPAPTSTERLRALAYSSPGAMAALWPLQSWTCWRH
jgi:hypothetical protein